MFHPNYFHPVYGYAFDQHNLTHPLQRQQQPLQPSPPPPHYVLQQPQQQQQQQQRTLPPLPVHKPVTHGRVTLAPNRPPVASLSQPPPPPSQTASSPTPPQPTTDTSQSKWPPSLVKFVSRALQSCSTREEKLATQTFLRNAIESATQQPGGIAAVDWANYPLPSLPRPVLSPAVHLSPPRTSLKRKSFEGQEKLENQEKKRRKIELAAETQPMMLGMSPGKKLSKKKKRQLASRAARFVEDRRRAAEPDTKSPGSAGGYSKFDLDNVDNWDDVAVKGTCERIDKRFFRLTSAPKPEETRPERVLRKSLQMVKTAWKKDSDYIKFNEQIKSIRQDLAVQHIRNQFTVDVYEYNARGDMSEFNQCQSQLHELYTRLESTLPQAVAHRDEFLGYRLLYFLVIANTAKLIHLLEVTPRDQLQAPGMAHAIKAMRAIRQGNYSQFFALFHNAPHQSGDVLVQLLPRVRFMAMKRICAAYVTFEVNELVSVLAFDDRDETVDFLNGSQAVFKDPDTIDARASREKIIEYHPEVEEDRGVTHGRIRRRA